ncbi:MAG TPA: 23S rRNA (pseudouridine(1915)-N(3))-methyltransferase RlmH [Candidatus Limiplasma sp.]|nr:23S rRNA (pseudouridine(1915)-N(3))-methyltransferase RlmH [Candidatus Limiplasma sp.]HRX08845.1 23S rRNA (pseudouridine(1915)-N(3))-methyltransferase RlmH [Candidatus Limiplasma sp.]
MITVLCVGKLRERFFQDAQKEYLKRLSQLMPCTVTEVPDEPEPKQLSDTTISQTLEAESERLLKRIPDSAYVIALCIDAKQPASEELADKLNDLFVSGKSEVMFVIGGSLGLSQSVLQRAQERLSMSRMTFPHQLARVMLLEQLYRAAKINAGQRYHK